MGKDLTTLQSNYLEFIRGFIQENQSAPRLDEIAKSFGVSSPTVHKALKALQDKGHIAEAQQVLMDNSSYLRSSAKKYKSEKLDTYAYENEKDADAVEKEDWNRTRKSMRESQTIRRTQR